jgi:hypothetical protein
VLVSVEALLVIVLVLTPGFIFTVALRKSVANLDTSAIRFVVMTVATGTIVHCVTYFWSARLLEAYLDAPASLLDRSLEVFLWSISTIFVVPLTLGLLIGYLSGTDRVDAWLRLIGFSYVQRLPSAWDYVVGLKEGFYVRVHLRDSDRIIGGVYGTSSFAADESEAVDLYLEELWQINDAGEFVAPIPTTRGVWIPRDSAQYIEFLSGEDLEDVEANNQ